MKGVFMGPVACARIEFTMDGDTHSNQAAMNKSNLSWPAGLGLRHALIQAPMAGVQDSALAIAVSRAGGLGSLPAALLDASALDRELHALRQALNPAGLPFNVNFFCHTPPTPDPAVDQAWQRTLAPYYQTWGLPQPEVLTGPLRQPFSAELASVLELHRPPVVSFHFGLPAPELLDRVKAWGAQVLSSATTVEEACWLEARGVDAVIVQGLEAGGHRGHFLRDDLAGQASLPPLLEAVSQAVGCPLVAAGGLFDRASVQAAFAAGAQAVQVGTAFLRCQEARTPALHRQALERAVRLSHESAGAASLTDLTRLFSGRPARGLINRLMREMSAASPDQVPAFPRASLALAPLRQAAEAQGCDDFTPLWCGQRVQGCLGGTAAEVVARLMG